MYVEKGRKKEEYIIEESVYYLEAKALGLGDRQCLSGASSNASSQVSSSPSILPSVVTLFCPLSGHTEGPTRVSVGRTLKQSVFCRRL